MYPDAADDPGSIRHGAYHTGDCIDVSIAFADSRPGTALGPLHARRSRQPRTSATGTAPGVDHPLRGPARCTRLIAANLTILAFAELCPDAMIQTRQRLELPPPRRRRPASCDHRRARRRGYETARARTYVGRRRRTVDVADAPATEPLWTSTVRVHAGGDRSGIERVTEDRATRDASHRTSS